MLFYNKNKMDEINSLKVNINLNMEILFNRLVNLCTAKGKIFWTGNLDRNTTCYF